MNRLFALFCIVLLALLITWLLTTDDAESHDREWYLTAYCLRGTTASGYPVGAGVVAVDPRVIPLGSYVYVDGKGPFRARDTGGAVKGRHVDVWISSCYQALRYTHYGQVWWKRGT